ncbi:MAG: hypothetical protein HOV80_11240 [Polyangiaceae bacterium]|nr:hypothetical protein [Polyangiaceae bacterium]
MFERKGGRLPPAIVAVMMGLGMVATSAVACDERQVDDDDGGGGGGSGDGSFGSTTKGPTTTTKASTSQYVGSTTGSDYPSAVSTYGVGPSSTSTSMTTGDECSGLDDGTPCGGCLAMSCCAEEIACLESQPCIDVSDCLNACDPNDLSCATECQQTYPEGFALYQTLWQCAQASCDVCFE